MLFMLFIIEDNAIYKSNNNGKKKQKKKTNHEKVWLFH